MKKLILFLFIPLFFISCAGGIKIVKDDFKNAIVVTMKLKRGSEESMFRGGGNGTFTFIREIKNDIPAPTVINLYVLKAKLPGNNDLDQRASVKIDDKSTEVILGDRSGVQTTSYSAQPNYATGGTQISSSQYEEWNAKMPLTKEIENVLPGCNSLAFRLYFGEKPVTFIFKEKDIAKIKEFLAAREVKN